MTPPSQGPLMSGSGSGWYPVSRFGLPSQTPGGTFGKDTGESSSRLGQIKKQAAASPGPGFYNLDHLDEKSWKCNTGAFQKSPRDHGWKLNKTPPIGQYATGDGFAAIFPKTKNGKLPQAPRECFLNQTAEIRSAFSPAPGKYDPKDMKHIRVHGWFKEKVEGKKPKVQLPGPGHYQINFAQVEEKVPNYAGTNKEAVKTFIDRIRGEKAKLPAPGHVGIPVGPDKKIDSVGPLKHAKYLLKARADV